MIEEEQIRKKKTLPIVIVFVLLTVSIILLGSYALWQMTKKQTNKNVVGTTCLSIDIEDESGDISLQNQYPMSDADGANTNPYTFTVTNNCDQDVNYIVALESLPAGNNESSSYLDYDYIRLQLDNDSPLTYGLLEGITNDNGVRDTKEITHHTLGAGESVTHNLRLWVDENTPLQNEDESYNMEKYFYGKIKVIAGQNINGDSAIPIAANNLKLLSDPNEPDVTINNIQVGDRVGFGTEQFYVIEIDGNNVKLLSRYLLNVGDYANPEGTQGLQYAELGTTRTNVSDINSIIEYIYNSGYNIYYGAVAFSDDSEFNESLDNYVYSNKASISNYVNSYVNTLGEMGLNITDGRLLSLDDVRAICDEFHGQGNNSTNCPSYLFETSYWIGNIYARPDSIYVIDPDGYVDKYSYYQNDMYGVRPVITVTLN